VKRENRRRERTEEEREQKKRENRRRERTEEERECKSINKKKKISKRK